MLGMKVTLGMLVTLVTLGLGSSGCAGAQAEAPEGALKAYARALDDGRAEDAYRMLSAEARKSVTPEAFRRMVRERPEEVRELARALSRPTAPASVTATVTTDSGQELELILENGQWRIDSAAVDLYAQDSPRHALQGFVRALERKRYDVILRYVPDSHREGLDAKKLETAWEGPDKDEMQQILAALKQALPSGSIEEVQDRASLVYGRGTVQLVRERGAWKIEDFD
jgi:hypothetical protein